MSDAEEKEANNMKIILILWIILCASFAYADYVEYVKATGAFVAQTENKPGSVGEDHALKYIPGHPAGLWDTSSLEFGPYPEKRVITKFAFLKRFTFPELVAIKDATYTDSEVSTCETLLMAAGDVDLDEPLLPYCLGVYVSKGLLAAGRPDEIRQ